MADSPEKRPDPESDWGRALRDVAPYLGIGTTFAAAVGLGLVAGHWLDGWLETDPLMTVVGGTAGLMAAFVHFYVTMSRGKR